MRYPAPLIRDQRVGDHVCPEILPIQPDISLAERIGRERDALLCHLIGLPLELLEHRLPKERALEALQIVIDEIRPLLPVLRLSEKILKEQDLIGRGGDLRHEDLIMRIQESLILRGIPGVHGMSHLMDQREHVVERSVPVEQHVRMDPVDTGGVGTAALSFIFRDIDPALAEGFADDLKVVLSERTEGCQHHLLRFLISHTGIEITHHRGIHIIHMQLLHA